MKRKMNLKKLALGKEMILGLTQTASITGGNVETNTIICHTVNQQTCNNQQCTLNSRFGDCLTRVETRCGNSCN